MMMSALEAGGLPLLVDGIREADQNNPRGYYEYERVKKLPKGDLDWLESANGKAVKVISALLEYLPDDYLYRVIFMERDIDEILASQKRMLARSRIDEKDSVSDQALRKSYQEHFSEVKSFLEETKRMEWMSVSYNEVLQNPEAAFERVAQFLSDRVNPAAMSRVVDPALYREKVNDNDLER
jgi:hypothetical protein